MKRVPQPCIELHKVCCLDHVRVPAIFTRRSRWLKAVLRAGAAVVTSRCWSLAEALRAEVVDLRAEIAEGLHCFACGEATAWA